MQRHCPHLAILCLCLFGLLAGCAHPVDWKARVGSYTYDDAVRELGPPDKKETLSDNTLVAEWLTARGWTHTSFQPLYPYHRHELVMTVEASTMSTPDTIVRLTFDPARKLTAYKRLYR
jgi:hypothetical protein